jgi:hypothetical protein
MTYLFKAIKKINPNAEFKLEGGNINDIEWLNNTTPISISDIETKATELETAEANAETQKATDKANGNQKLLDLGLTQAEATALTGYTPPTEV